MATRRKPEGPKARQVRVPSKKAAPIPERESPVTRIGDPAIKIKRLLKRADFHVAGEDWIRLIAPDTALSTVRALVTGSILENLGMEFEFRKRRCRRSEERTNCEGRIFWAVNVGGAFIGNRVDKAMALGWVSSSKPGLLEEDPCCSRGFDPETSGSGSSGLTRTAQNRFGKSPFSPLVFYLPSIQTDKGKFQLSSRRELRWRFCAAHLILLPCSLRGEPHSPQLFPWKPLPRLHS